MAKEEMMLYIEETELEPRGPDKDPNTWVRFARGIWKIVKRLPLLFSPEDANRYKEAKLLQQELKVSQGRAKIELDLAEAGLRKAKATKILAEAERLYEKNTLKLEKVGQPKLLSGAEADKELEKAISSIRQKGGRVVFDLDSFETDSHEVDED